MSTWETKDCLFCQMSSTTKATTHGTVYSMRDQYPVTLGHTLIVPYFHRKDYFSLTAQEKQDVDQALMTLSQRMIQHDPEVSGFNIGWNCGVVAGQSIMHAHCHLIPRRKNDMYNPRGGVRGVIPEKQKY